MLRAPGQAQALVAHVEAGFLHAGLGAQVALDQPAAGGAADPLDQQGGLLPIAFTAREALLHVFAVIQLQLVLQCLRQGLRVGRGLGAMLIVGVQACTADGLRYSLAAWAAHGARCAEQLNRPGRTGRNRFATVVAGGGLGHARISGRSAGNAGLCQGAARRSDASRLHRACPDHSARYSDDLRSAFPAGRCRCCR